MMVDSYEPAVHGKEGREKIDLRTSQGTLGDMDQDWEFSDRSPMETGHYEPGEKRSGSSSGS